MPNICFTTAYLAIKAVVSSILICENVDFVKKNDDIDIE